MLLLLLTFWTLLCGCVSESLGTSNFIDNDFFSRMREDLASLCPKVDICNRSASEPKILPNGIIDTLDGVSCCQGCSCHENCHENMNCCFSDEDNNTSHTNTKKVMDCIYIKTGEPDDTWPTSVPAYRMVTSAPNGGCKQQTKSPTQRASSCGKESVALWGNFLPVYSRRQDKIYKNQLCARCHGVFDGEAWVSFLVCDKYRGSAPIPISEIIQLLENGLQTSICSVMFHFPDESVVHDKRCYKKSISSCDVPSKDESFLLPSISNLTAIEIVKACKSGLTSSVPTLFAVYKNMFCAICNQAVLSHPKVCYNTDQKGFDSSKIFLLIDVDIYQTNSRKRVVSRPQACLWNDDTRITEKCRYVFCPSGQIRNSDGKCVFTASRWYEDSFMVSLELIDDQNTNNLVSLLQGSVSKDAIFQAFANGSPWPQHWKVTRISYSLESGDFHEAKFVNIILLCDIKTPKVLINDIRDSLVKPWYTVLNGTSIRYQQSFLEYTLVSGRKVLTWVPLWVKETNGADLQTSPNLSAPALWTILRSKRFSVLPYMLNKLHTCEQISLSEEEYTLMAKNTILVSNLTCRVLFDAEFDLLYGTDGVLCPRVCVSDTVLVMKHKANRALATCNVRFVMNLVGTCMIHGMSWYFFKY